MKKNKIALLLMTGLCCVLLNSCSLNGLNNGNPICSPEQQATNQCPD